MNLRPKIAPMTVAVWTALSPAPVLARPDVEPLRVYRRRNGQGAAGRFALVFGNRCGWGDCRSPSPRRLGL